MKDTYEQGIAGESEAEEYLSSLGMKPLCRRWKCACGEIDLILLDTDNTIVFVEVKKRRTGQPGTGLYAIDRKKQKRVSQAALLYLVKYGKTEYNVRFDAVEVHSGQITYIRDAFEPGGLHLGGGARL